MSRRVLEFFSVLLAAALVATLLLRERVEEPDELVESPRPSPAASLPTASSSVPDVSPSSTDETVMYTPVVREDYEYAAGLQGHEEVLGTEDYKYGRRELAVFRTGKFGVEGTGMPPWAGILSDEELWCITHCVVFLQEEEFSDWPALAE